MDRCATGSKGDGQVVSTQQAIPRGARLMVRSRIVTNETSAPLIYSLLIYFFLPGLIIVARRSWGARV